MSRQTLIIIIIAVVFGGAGLWFFYFQSSSSTEPGAANISFSSSNPEVQRIEQELADLRRLKDLQLDTSILKNSFLQSLEVPRATQGSGTSTQYTTPGRANPFLPF